MVAGGAGYGTSVCCNVVVVAGWQRVIEVVGAGGLGKGGVYTRASSKPWRYVVRHGGRLAKGNVGGVARITARRAANQRGLQKHKWRKKTAQRRQ